MGCGRAPDSVLYAVLGAHSLDRLVTVATMVHTRNHFPCHCISQTQAGRTLWDGAQLADPCLHFGNNRSVLVKVHAQGLNERRVRRQCHFLNLLTLFFPYHTCRLLVESIPCTNTCAEAIHLASCVAAALLGGQAEEHLSCCCCMCDKHLAESRQCSSCAHSSRCTNAPSNIRSSPARPKKMLPLDLRRC